jgi:prepilin-type N-terminal cleavage/methylation domain-containing protein
MRDNHLGKTHGFTLLELIIVIMLIGIIAGISSKMLSQGFSGYFNTRNVLDADWQARLATERMQRDIRDVRSPVDIATAAASQLVFTNTEGNQITYSLSGTTLMRQTNTNTTQVLADGVQSLTFTYFDRTGAVTTTLANIRYIEFSLNIVLNNTNFTVSSAAYTRNSP